MNIRAEASERANSVIESIQATVDMDTKWGRKLAPEEDEVRRFILREFPNLGSAPTNSEIAEALSLPSEEVEGILKNLHESDIIYMKDGEILGAYPFSARPTVHKVALKGGRARKAYALCAIDALGIPFMFDEDVDIESACVHCGEGISIKIRDGSIVEQLPEGALVWIGLRYSSHAATSLCTSLVFLHSKEHLEKWRTKNPGEDGKALSLAEGMHVGKVLFEGRLREK
ncbi:MAG: alkylmercury lyase family protein [Candidatus Hydrothermarchaeaceae archaeon]